MQMSFFMKLNTHFLIASLAWRGLRNSPFELAAYILRLPEELSLEDYQDFLMTHFLLPKAISKVWFETSWRELEWLESNGASWVSFFDANYPDFFRTVEGPPMLLTWWGEAMRPHGDFISVVGSRRPSRDSLQWMDDFFDLFVRQSHSVVVSGGAHGVDQKAHILALRNQRPTMAIIPSGLQNIYPSTLKNWKPMIVETGGAVVSALSPFSQMEKRYFLERNRYIAAWSKITFIVEAKRRSGTMITARWAKKYNRDVAVLPSSPNHAGMGGLDILAGEGGLLIRDQYDLLQAYNSASVKSLPVFGEGEGLS